MIYNSDTFLYAPIFMEEINTEGVLSFQHHLTSHASWILHMAHVALFTGTRHNLLMASNAGPSMVFVYSIVYICSNVTVAEQEYAVYQKNCSHKSEIWCLIVL